MSPSKTSLSVLLMVPLRNAIFLVASGVRQGLALCSRKGSGGSISGKAIRVQESELACLLIMSGHILMFKTHYTVSYSTNELYSHNNYEFMFIWIFVCAGAWTQGLVNVRKISLNFIPDLYICPAGPSFGVLLMISAKHIFY